MEIPSAIVAFTIIMGIAYWINNSREEKATAAATEKAIKTARDELEITTVNQEFLKDKQLKVQTMANISYQSLKRKIKH